MLKIKLKCRQCGKPFETSLYLIKIGKGKFCSNFCFRQSRKTREERKCLVCGESFEVLQCEIKKGSGKYCSRKCYAHSLKGFIHPNFKGRRYTSLKSIKVERKCLICGEVFKVFKSKVKAGGGKYCSRKCFSNSCIGIGHPNWKGGRTIKEGYVFIYNPNHPYCNQRGYVREHRLVMEKRVGRYLETVEIVHHIDENPQNNLPENLELFENSNEHLKYHREQRKKQDLMSV